MPNFFKIINHLTFLTLIWGVSAAKAHGNEASDLTFWMKIKAEDKFQRTALEEMGIPIDMVRDDYVISYGGQDELSLMKAKGLLIASTPITKPSDFPTPDAIYHNYAELTAAVQKLAQENTDIIALQSIGKSVEGRDIWHLRISTDLANSRQKPAVIFMGGHHAREHLSIDVPLRLTQKLIEDFRAGDARVVRLIQSREIHMIPMVNPDGAEFDISTGNYKMWRKNRRHNHDGSYGVDLNRNYGYQWGTGGSSTNPRADTFMGPSPFSEPETQAIKNFVEQQDNATLLLSFHTYSELILYPWGHTYDAISDARDLSVYRTMAQTMANWNNYSPQQSSELYQASGDTTDWAFGTQHIFSFTFELDPQFSGGGWGFYPGPGVIPEVVRKNWEPFLYMMEYADNPYRVLEPKLSLGF
jgi:carboxypeptidase T